MNITSVNQNVMISNTTEMEVKSETITTLTDKNSAVVSGTTDISEKTRSTGICQTVVETNVTSLSGVLAQDDKQTDYKEALDYVVNTMTEEDYEYILQEGIVLEDCEVGRLESILQRRKENAEFGKENSGNQTELKKLEEENREDVETVVNNQKYNDATVEKTDRNKQKDLAAKKVGADKYKDTVAKKADADKSKDSAVKEADIDKYKDPIAKEAAQKLVDANLPVTDSNVNAMLNALKLSDVVTQLSEDGMAHLISKEIPITLESIYNSQYSATKVQAPQQAVWQEVSGQAESILREAGFEITEEVMEKAKWLFEHRLPISENTMDAYNSLLEFREGIEPELLLTKMTEAMQQGKAPEQADLNVVLSSKMEQAVRDFAKISEKAVVKVVENGEKLNLVHLKQAQQEMTEQNIHKDFSQNVEKNANQSVQQGASQKIEQNTNQKAEENVSQKTEQNANQKVNENVSQKAEQNLSQKVNENVSQKAEQNLNQKVNENVSQNTDQNASQKILAVEGESAAEITAYRQLEEIRLKLTLEAAHSLAGKGIRIDTSDLQKVVEGLKELERQYYEGLLEEGHVEKTDANIALLKETTETVESVKTMPAAVLGATLKVNVAQSMETLHETGKELKASYDKAGVAYEPLMTAPRADMGDSIQKAFRNVDSILENMDMEVTEDNRRAVRILGYNRMEIDEDSVMAVKAYDSQVTSLVKELHPAATVELIRRGVNPLDMPMETLIDEVKQVKEELGVTAEEKYSTYLWKLQKQEDISETERKSYVGIYRLLNNVEKTDGAAIGAVLDTGKELTMGNLLTAVRTLKHKGVNVKVNDDFGALESLTFTKETITEQIQTGFERKTPEIKENVSAQIQTGFDGKTPELKENISAQIQTEFDTKTSESEVKRNSSNTSTSEEMLKQDTLTYQQNTVKEIVKQISPDKLAQIAEAADGEQTGLDKLLNLSLEQLKDALQQTEEKTVVQRDMSAEERKSYETIPRFANDAEKIDGSEVKAAVQRDISAEERKSYKTASRFVNDAEKMDGTEVKAAVQREISTEERRSYETISRLVNSVEKMDEAELEAAVESVRDTEKPATVGNLLTAIRALRNQDADGRRNDQFGALEQERNLFNRSASDETLRQNTTAYQRNTVKEIVKQISPDKLAQIAKATDGDQSGFDKLLNLSLEELKDALQQTEEKPVVQRDIRAEERRSYEAVSRLVNDVEKIDGAEVKAAVQRDISAEERRSYEAISRLVNSVEKMDEAELEAAVESVRDTEKPATVGNLLTAIRALRNQDAEQQNIVKEIAKQLSPDKLAQIVKSMGGKQADLSKVLNMPLEQLKEALQQTEGKPAVQREISAEERKNYEAVSRLVNNMEKMDGAKVDAAIKEVLNTGKVLTMGNLLTAVRNPKNKGIDTEANDRFSKAETSAFSKENGIQQIQMGFGKNASDTRKDSSDNNASSDETLKQNTLTYQQNTVKEILEQISPDKLAQILEAEDEWTGFDKLMNMTLEQLKEALQKAEGNPALEKDYVKERLEEIRTVAGKSKEALDYLEQYHQPVSIERLTIVLEYFVGDKNLFKEFKKYADKVSDNKFDQKIAKVKEGETEELTEVMDSVWESIDEPEQLQDKFAEMERKAEEVLQREYAAPDISSEDIRTLRLLGKAIALTGSMSRQEHYEIPMKTGDSITNVSLTIRKGSGEKGKLQISMISEKYGRIEVEATIKKQAINGVILCESKEGLNKLNGCKKQLQDELKEIGVTVKQLSTAISEKALERLRSSEETNSQTDTSLLYKTAKVIIRQLRAVETE